MKPERIIYRTPIMTRYQSLREMTQQEGRRDEAQRLMKVPDELAHDFARSVEGFRRYDNRIEHFFGKRKSHTPNPAMLKKTYDVTLRLEGQELLEPQDAKARVYEPDVTGVQPVAASALRCRYAEKELVPQRTTTPAKWDDGARNRGGVRLDVLLADDDPDTTPIIGEVKVGRDMDPFFALVQAMTCAAHMVTPHQYERLRSYIKTVPWPDREEPRVDLWLLLADPVGHVRGEPLKGKYMPTLTAAANSLAQMMLVRAAVTEYVRRIVAVGVYIDPHDNARLAGEVKWAWEAAT